jgi:hypothetical protein
LEEKLVMSIKRYKPEQIVTMLRQIEVSIANGKTTPQACKEAEITVQTYYRWRKCPRIAISIMYQGCTGKKKRPRLCYAHNRVNE